jgi:hypothetical protein
MRKLLTTCAQSLENLRIGVRKKCVRYLPTWVQYLPYYAYPWGKLVKTQYVLPMFSSASSTVFYRLLPQVNTAFYTVSTGPIITTTVSKKGF